MSLSAIGFSSDYIVDQLLGIPGFVIFLCFRGFCKAWTANKLGDNTAYMNGYMTLSPRKHINPIGFIFLVLFGFGFSNPVPVNSRKFKKLKRDNAIQILSSPASGIVLMFISTLLLYIVHFILNKAGVFVFHPIAYYNSAYYTLKAVVSVSGTGAVLANAALFIIAHTSLVSVYLAIFFLMPLPGFDGYALIANFLPYRYYSQLYRIEKYSMYIYIVFIIALRAIPSFSDIIMVPATELLSLAHRLFSLIFLI